MGNFTISMVICHSYVKLPEGIVRIIDVPNSHWLVDQSYWLIFIEGFEGLPLKQQVSMMIDGINQLPAPLFLPKGHYWPIHWIRNSLDEFLSGRLSTAFSLSWHHFADQKVDLRLGNSPGLLRALLNQKHISGWWFGTWILVSMSYMG